MIPKNLRAAAVAAGVVAIAAGAAVASGQAPAQPSTLHFTATPKGGSGLDLGRKGPSIGDEFFERGNVTGSVSGRFQLVTQLVAGNSKRGTEQNEITLLLPNGQIAAGGVHATTGRFDNPVAGGTGAYEGAHGVLSVAPGRGENESLTVELDR